jgi:hypothetical protein
MSTVSDVRYSIAFLRAALNGPDDDEGIRSVVRGSHRDISRIWRMMRRVGGKPPPSKPIWARRPDWSPGEFAASLLDKPIEGTPEIEEVHEALDAAEAWCNSVVPLPESEQKTVEWSDARPPSDWSKLFKLSTKTLKRRIGDGLLRAMIVNSKSWKICIDDIPKT